jgi:hypothetical protein
MITSQLDRLKQDSQELDYYVQRLQKEGKVTRVLAIQKKQKFLQDYIDSLQNEEIIPLTMKL